MPGARHSRTTSSRGTSADHDRRAGEPRRAAQAYCLAEAGNVPAGYCAVGEGPAIGPKP